MGIRLATLYDFSDRGDDDDGWLSWDEVQKFATNCRNLAPQSESSIFYERKNGDIPREEAVERFVAKHQVSLNLN